MQQIDAAERQRRLAVRHHLGPGARGPSVVDVADDMVGLHGTDPTSAYLGARARTRDLAAADLENCLYDERSLVKITGMRRTMFVLPRELAGVVHWAVTRDLIGPERRRLIGWVRDAGAVAGDPDEWLDDLAGRALAELHELGLATASQLTRRVPGLGLQIPFGEGRRWGGTIGISTRVLFLLSIEGRILRARPRGGWTSSLYQWAPTTAWLGEPLAEHEPAAARAELCRRWLRAFGPGRTTDVRWWTGWTMGATRRALADCGAVEVTLDEGTGHVLPDDLETATEPAPWVALLPALDSTTMGWQDRSWFLGQHGHWLFDRNGNAGPTVWVDGRVVGGWAQRRSGEIGWQLLEDVGREARDAIAAEADGLLAWLGELRVMPRFRTPLELELELA